VAYKKSVQLTVDTKPSVATNKTFTWTSNSSNVTVNAKGVVTAKNYITDKEEGYVTITATATDGSGLSCQFHVYVTTPATKVAIRYAGDKEASTSIGIDLDKNDGKIQLDTIITGVLNKETLNIENQTVTWKSSNTSIATVDENGEVTGLKVGKVTITATVGDGTKKSGSVTLYVGKLVNELTLTLNNDKVTTLIVAKGKKVNISTFATISVTPITASCQTLSYESADKTIATVDQKGNITGKKVGTTQIIVKTTDGSNISKIINVRVY
jgi:uncharacterized protein YjdB